MRAYVASLIAVFLALAIGILLGTVIQERAPLVDQVEKQIASLQSEFAAVREENKDLTREQERNLAFQRKVFPVLTSGKIAGQSVVVLTTGRVSKQLVRRVTESLEGAGADVSEIDVLRYDTDQELRNKISGYLSKDAALARSTTSTTLKPGAASGEEASPDAAANLVDLPKVVAAAVADGKAKPAATDLVQLGVLRLSGPLDKARTAVVVLVDPEADDRILSGFLLPLAEQLATYKLNIVAGESGSSPQSIMGDFGEAGITTVDNVDELTGQISLIYSVAGQKGSFGKKKGADEIVPALQ